MVVFDTSVLAIAFDKDASVPIDPETGASLEKCKERIDFLIKTLSRSKSRILIPTPVLSEYLIQGGTDKDKRLQEFYTSKVFSIAPFDQRAAVECAMLHDPDLNGKRKLSENETKAKLKFDRQIIAIAKTNRVSVLYTGDKGLAYRASENAINVMLTWKLALPPDANQLVLDYSPASHQSGDIG